MHRIPAGFPERTGFRRVDAEGRLERRQTVDREERPLGEIVAQIAPAIERRDD
jgi:hypothetical protein